VRQNPVYMKWFILLLPIVGFHFSLRAQNGLNQIRTDQEGYYPNAPKIAIVVRDSAARDSYKSFFVVREHSTDTVFRGRLSGFRRSLNSSLEICVAEFNALNKTGSFRLLIPGYPPSYPFRVEEKVHRAAALASLKAFYFMRASMALLPEYAGKWSRSAGHPDDSVIIHPSAESPIRKTGSIISTAGGWYDAGDYNKYMVNSGISTSTLLTAFQDFDSYFDSLHSNIPATDKSVPDLLTEVIYNLRWMLSMQDPEDGGVYNKCTNAHFDSMIMPEMAKEPRYVVQKGTAATLDLAAVAAQAAGIFSKYESQLPGLSDSCKRAAEKAWNWAIANPNLAYDQNAMNLHFEPRIVTGGYGDRKFSDEWFWAACELFQLSGEKKYQDTILKHVHESFGLPSWSATGLLGYYSLIQKKAVQISNTVDDTIRNRLIEMADRYLRAAQKNAFLTVMGGRKSDFTWGSNSNAANQGILLIKVFLITKKQKYLDAALGNLDYICGRNATGYCFITGIGVHSPMHPHHRPSIADGVTDPVPGMLVGGPNPGEQDHCHYDFHEPETAYTDQDGAYASNEIAINWNAPLVYLTNGIEALEKKFSLKNNRYAKH
jgi:endoglucanase